MKKFAYYLPQFHTIPENDAWWGNGFTEWTNVKRAKPLFKGHEQPKIPLDKNYYCLLDPETINWQAKLAQKYSVDGFILYHYYFNGKKLLEKPAELILKNKNISIGFFFCWANHSWIRSWEGTQQLLMEQKYGRETDWDKHFQYLLPFFRDERYEKRNNKPLFLLFKPSFEEKKEMMLFFDQKCRENGFNGICVIETNAIYHPNVLDQAWKHRSPATEYLHIREPGPGFHSPKGYLNRAIKFAKPLYNTMMKHGYIRKFSGDYLFRYAIRKLPMDPRYIPGLYFEWDNTPRHGLRGYIITPPQKDTFFAYMDKIQSSEYVFINSWNEWCEGMMLEPTEQEGYKYLEWIREWDEKQK